MRVFGSHISTDPKRPCLAFRGGDVCDPQDGEQLNGPPWPTEVKRWFCRWPILPFVCVKLGRFGFYAGWKCYGFDLPNYRYWAGGALVHEVYEGSLALELTARFFTDG